MSILADQLQSFSLAGAGAVVGDTTLVLKSMQTIDGSDVAMADFGTKGYGTIEPGNNALEEQISFTGITQNSNGTATLTGVKSVGFVSPYTETTGLTKTHAGSTTFIISNTSAFTASYANKNNVENITANWTVPDPVGATDIANKEYVLSVVSGGTVSFDQEIVSGTAGENLTQAQVVYLKNDGKWWKASASAASTCLNVQLGICQTTANTGVATTVLVSGMDKHQSALSVGTTYYLQDTAGTLGSSAGTISVDLGEAISATTLQFNPFAATTKVLSSVSNVRTSTTGATSQVPIGASSGAPNIDITWLNATTGTTDQSQTTRNGGITFGEANLTTKHYLVAQSFVPARQSISAVTLYKDADTGSFTGTVKVSLQADSSGSPSGSDLASYTISNATWLKLTAAANFTIAFSTEYETLTVGSTYWIVATPSTTDNSNHPNLGLNTAGGYAAGTLKYNNTADGWVTVATSKLNFATIDGVLGKIPRTSSTTGLLPSTVSPYSFVDADATTTTVTSDTTATTVYSKSIAAGFFTANSGVRVRAVFLNNLSGAAGAFTTNVKLNFNGTQLISLTSGALNGTNAPDASKMIFDVYVVGNSSTSAQKIFGTMTTFPVSQVGTATSGTIIATLIPAVSITTTALDLAAPGVLSLVMTNSANTANSNSTYSGCIVEKIG